MPRTFAVRVAKQEALRLLAEAMRRKQDEFKEEKKRYPEEKDKIDLENAKLLAEFKSQVAKAKHLKDISTLRSPSTLQLISTIIV